ncbi:hypothetical protein UFOVP1640_12 [uncultured Caudovirales phage]|uniref:Phage tail assembly chaperone protein n=1 Tax=uncultured Caudovirales phage TaxID=2100421 RepID=A0A6J5RSL3_9CAUD|nr:hypothetical protein UFOVP1286_15 [uncultured Caudovirales phage]CAB4205554.1 hypothetical protein UFOVP1407_45 [uncultured Caudovirales phage]CAB4221611.1 hypothetical protein UFOVP1640_12 [uncultured Caudovirales phage]
MINYPLILSINYTNDPWSIIGNDYETLEWFSDTPKPTQEELDALWSSTEETQAKNTCKQQATAILQSTDWTSIADVGDPTKSNPYLVNQAAFISYRSTVRNLAVNPVENPVFPTAPTEEWSS